MKKEPSKPPPSQCSRLLLEQYFNKRRHEAIMNVKQSQHKHSIVLFIFYSIAICLSLTTIVLDEKNYALAQATTLLNNTTPPPPPTTQTTQTTQTNSTDHLIPETIPQFQSESQTPTSHTLPATTTTTTTMTTLTTITIATLVKTSQQQQQQQQLQGSQQSNKDFKLSSITSSNFNNNNSYQNNNNKFDQSISRIPFCTLGNGTYQLGERWNPNLPPFGVQVCVQCECTVRQRKNCYESRVTCRRITNECPIINSCPDGKKPVTNLGQCCKSCQATATSVTNATDQEQQQAASSVAGAAAAAIAASASASASASAGTSASFSTSKGTTSALNSEVYQSALSGLSTIDRYYRNDRIKEYHSIIKNLEACSKTKENNGLEKQTINLIFASNKSSCKSSSSSSSSTSSSSLSSSSSGSKNDLNGIDSRLAFKSLHDTQSNLYHTNHVTNSHQISRTSSLNNNNSRNNMINNNNYFDNNSNNNKFSSTTPDDIMKHDQQHPNDVQTLSNSFGVVSQTVSPTMMSSQNIDNHQHQNNNRFMYNSISKSKLPSHNTCTLGNETFEVGDRWNPELPPFGVQVCVLCNCIVIRDRSRACYETKVQCKRINSDCAVIDYCSDGSRPVSIPGQCCKGCPNNNNINNNILSKTLPFIEQQSNLDFQQQQQGVIFASERILQKNEKVLKEFNLLMKQFSACSKRDGDSSTTTTSPPTTLPVTSKNFDINNNNNNNNYKFVRRSSD